MPAQIKPNSFESRRNFFFFSLLPGADAPQDYVRAWTPCCFHGLVSIQTFRRALTVARVTKRPFNGVTNCARVRRKVPKSDARNVATHTPSIAFRHLPPNSARTSYATEGTLSISTQLSIDVVSALRKVWIVITLRASLAGTFLQTLPDLVTPLKGH